MFFFIPLLLYAGFTPLRDLYGIEARNALFAREMLINGLSMVPCIHGRPYPDYPPLYFLLEYLFSLPTGRVTTFSAVLPSAAAAAALVSLTYIWIAQISRGMAVVSCLILATAPGFWLKAGSATIDMLLALETFSAFYFFSKAHTCGTAGGLRAIILHGLGTASIFLALITKGPVGMVLPLGAWMFYLCMEKEWGQLYRFILLAIIIFLLFAGTYFFMLYMQGGTRLAAACLEAQVTGRIGTTPNRAWYYYPLFLTTSFLPWLGLAGSLPLLMPRLLNRSVSSVNTCCHREHSHAEEKSGINPGRKNTEFTCSALLNQCAAGMFFTIAIFSMAGSRHGRYLLPAFPFIAVIIAAFICKAVSSACTRRDNILQSSLRTNARTCPSEKIIHIITGMALCLAAGLVLNVLLVQPFISRQESGRQFIEGVEKTITQDTHILIFKIRPDGDGLKLALYSSRRPGSLEFTSSIRRIKQIQKRCLIITYDKKLYEIKNLPATYRYKIIAHGLLHRKKISAVMIYPATAFRVMGPNGECSHFQASCGSGSAQYLTSRSVNFL